MATILTDQRQVQAALTPCRKDLDELERCCPSELELRGEANVGQYSARLHAQHLDEQGPLFHPGLPVLGDAIEMGDQMWMEVGRFFQERRIWTTAS